jgi:hypothetical protein
MHVSTMVRRRTALLAVLVAAAACSDAPSAPPPRDQPGFAAMIQASASRSSNGDDHASNGNGRGNHASADGERTLVIDPRVARSYAFGDHSIYFPAYSICDPATSGYGPPLWDAPCQPQTTTITVTVKWSSKGGHAYARFEPKLRFVPAGPEESSRWVILTMYDRRKVNDVDQYQIYYETEDEKWVDEAKTDPTLRAWTDRTRNVVYRRIKHFSGYMLAAGLTAFIWEGGDAGY